MRTAMRNPITRSAVGLMLAAASIALAACGGEGSSGTKEADKASGAGCAPIAGNQLVVLDDDKKLQTADNVVPVIRDDKLTDKGKTALNKVSAALTSDTLAELNKKVDIDKADPATVANDFLKEEKLI